MMNVSDEQIADYREARMKMEKNRSVNAAFNDPLYDDLIQKLEKINEARERKRER